MKFQVMRIVAVTMASEAGAPQPAVKEAATSKEGTAQPFTIEFDHPV